MYSCERDHRTDDGTTSYLQPCAAGRSMQLLPAHHHQRAQVDNPAGAHQQQQQQPRRASKKKHGARPPSRRSSTTVVATDVNNFRAMVQELTGFPPAAIFRPLPRRVHAAVASPFAVAAGQGQAGAEAATTNGLSSDAPATRPVMMAQSTPCAPPPGFFDGLSDIGSPVFDSWADLSIE